MRDIEENMSAHELIEWMAYDILQPFGSFRDNWHAAQLTALMANANRKRNTRPFRIDEFMWVDAATRRQQAEDQTLAWLMAHSSEEKP